jgi:hypothetical protein
MVTVHIVDVDEIEGSDLIYYVPGGPKFDAKAFKKKSCIIMDINEFVVKFNEGSLDLDDQKHYIYMEI